MRRLICLVTVLTLATFGSVVAAKFKVKVDKDKDFDFAAARTWAWAKSGAGVVKMLRTADDDSESVRQRLEPTILDAITQELTRRGFTAVSAGEPDVRVTYYLLVTVGQSAQVMGQFLPATTAWGLPPFAQATQSYTVVQQGSFVIDLGSPKLETVVWRGVAQAEINETRSDAERKTRIQEAVRDLIRRIPRK